MGALKIECNLMECKYNINHYCSNKDAEIRKVGDIYACKSYKKNGREHNMKVRIEVKIIESALPLFQGKDFGFNTVINKIVTDEDLIDLKNKLIEVCKVWCEK